MLTQYGVGRVEDLPVNFAGISLQEGEEYGNLVFDRHYTRLWDTFQRQDQFKQFAALAAPMLAIRSLSMGLAGTDFAQHRDFAEAAEHYRRALVKKMNDDMTLHAGKADYGYTAGPALWQEVPDFQYAAPSAGRCCAARRRASSCWRSGSPPRPRPRSSRRQKCGSIRAFTRARRDTKIGSCPLVSFVEMI